MAASLQRTKYPIRNGNSPRLSLRNLVRSLHYNLLTCHLPALLYLCISPVCAIAQQIHFDQMSISDGLSSNSVYCTFQDSYGTIWFGTLDGLNRYDGYLITTFRHDNQKKRSLSNNRITQIYEDSQHRLWLYDEYSSTLIKYDPQKAEFFPYYLDKVAGNELRALDSFYEKDGNLYVRSIDGYELVYNPKDDIFEFVKRELMSGWAEKRQWSQLVKAFDQSLAQSKSAFNVNSIEIRKIVRDSEGRYWIATKYDGIYSAVTKNGSFAFTSHLHSSNKFQQVNSEEIYDVYEDRSHVIWIGTKNHGLYRYSRYKYKFDLIDEFKLNSEIFRLGTVRAIAEDDDKNIWVGTNEQGLIRIDASHKNGKHYRPDSRRTSIGHRFVRSLWIDSLHNLWIGHYGGFSRYRAATDDFEVYRPQTSSNEQIRVYDFKKGKHGTIWMAGWDIILHFDPETNQFRTISKSGSGKMRFVSENIRDLELDKSRDLWIAVGEKGMSLYDKSKKEFKTLYYTSTQANGLPSNNLFDVFRDSHDRIWLATADGLCQFDTLHMSYKTFTMNEGLPSNLLYGIMEDNNENLWISTSKGLARFDTKLQRFRNYDASDGLQSNEFTENAFFKNKEGVMFFGGINGLNIFHPDQIPDNPTPPQVIITNIKVYDKPLSETQLFNEVDIKRKLSLNEEILLLPEQRSISIDFIGLHYVNPLKNKFAYRLEGFDENWTYRDANVRFANYTNLEPGTYEFKVKAANSDGVWSDPVSLKITIKKPFYESWIFISSIALVLIAIGVYAYRWRISVVKKQQSMKSIQLESELNFLKSQVNPHFLFNTLNNIYALCQVNSRNAAPMVGKISEMMRYMIYDCNSDLVPLKKEIDYLQNYIDLNQLKSHRKLNATIKVEGSPDGLKIAPLLLINFLENSFKHGDVNVSGDGFVRTDISIEGHRVILRIENSFRNGPDENSHQKGIGLDNVKHRLTLLYPGKHFLKIEKNNSIFGIHLKIQLD